MNSTESKTTPEEQLRVEVGGRSYILVRRSDLETLWAAMDDLDEDERLPYWVEPWPAGLALARLLAERPELVAGRRCVDLGCGLGLSSLVALAHGASVLAVDYASEALGFVIRSARANGLVPPQLAVMDWRAPALRPGSVEVLLAADVLYEARFMEPLLALFEQVLAPRGRVLLADPDRPFMETFLERAEARGFSRRLLSTTVTPTPSRPELVCGVSIHELRPPDADREEK